MLVNEFGKFVAATRYEDIPADVLEAVKVRLLDVLTSALVGFHFNNHRHVLPLLARADEATLWGDGRRLGLRDAALVNSFLAHSTYMEDGARFTGGHPSSAVIPAVVALAEREHASGRDLLAAIVAGYEVFLRIGRTIFPSTVVRGFQSTAVLAAVGSAAACANLLRMSPDMAKNALAIASTLGVGLKAALKCSESQPLQVGRSCEGGLLATLVAGQGAAGADVILEQGFMKAFADHAVEGDMLTGLGSRFSIGETYLKMHGGCRGTHAPVDAVHAAVSANGIKAPEIAAITIRVGSVTFAGDIEEPRDGNQAQFSAAFCAAVLLLEGNASVFQFADEKVADPRIRALMDRIKVEADPALDKVFPGKRGASAEIVLSNGRRFRADVDHARGEPENPLTARDIEDKFLTHTKGILGANAERVRDTVMALEETSDISALVALLKRG